MCVGIDEIRDIALGLEMEGLENWVYQYQKVLIDEKQGEIVGFWKQVVNKTDGSQRRDLRHRRQLVPARTTTCKIEWQRDFFDFGHVSKMFMQADRGGRSQRRACRSASSARWPVRSCPATTRSARHPSPIW